MASAVETLTRFGSQTLKLPKSIPERELSDQSTSIFANEAASKDLEPYYLQAYLGVLSTLVGPKNTAVVEQDIKAESALRVAKPLIAAAVALDTKTEPSKVEETLTEDEIVAVGALVKRIGENTDLINSPSISVEDAWKVVETNPYLEAYLMKHKSKFFVPEQAKSKL